ncbi:hypothetical protein HBH64_008080 [Parastagonospora nodorum]|nr:hypothetical protein HBI03_080830 [Parastagonospora nodorum]KAH4283139.1 hypothetical protein HBI04_019240 [Parastagonospora nodorum]KAH4313173.1 hypothetical protein HBI01_005620 [Parastagonospora nodorum]KAH4315897.1 hypothetical protein HBI02_043220 [Parastagonospora nodorum]KAH4332377.1 hypothetical protein HBI00_057670 [Parastagonospora nodorum]
MNLVSFEHSPCDDLRLHRTSSMHVSDVLVLSDMHVPAGVVERPSYRLTGGQCCRKADRWRDHLSVFSLTIAALQVGKRGAYCTVLHVL